MISGSRRLTLITVERNIGVLQTTVAELVTVKEHQGASISESKVRLTLTNML